MAEEKTKVEENVNTEENTSPKASEEENQEESSEEQSVQDYVPGVDRPAKTYEEVAKEMSKKKGDSSFSIKGLKDKVAESSAWGAVKNTVCKVPKVFRVAAKVTAGAWGAAYLTDRFLDGKEQRGDNVDETTFVSRGKDFFSNNFDDEKAFASRGKAFVSEKFDDGKTFVSEKFNDGKDFLSEKFGGEKTDESQTAPNSGTEREIPYVAEIDNADVSMDYS